MYSYGSPYTCICDGTRAAISIRFTISVPDLCYLLNFFMLIEKCGHLPSKRLRNKNSIDIKIMIKVCMVFFFLFLAS